MNILLVYATNSGGTQMASDTVKETLVGASHTVDVKEALEAKSDDIASHDLLILASPSWDYNGMEGQPHEHIVTFLQSLTDVALDGKKCAIFGLGDSSYTYFCGAVTYMETFAKRKNLNLIVPSLKIDGYFYHQQEATDTLKKWSTELASVIQTIPQQKTGVGAVG